MRFGGLIAGIGRRLTRRFAARKGSVELDPLRPQARTACFPSSLTDAQRLAVLTAIVAAGRPPARNPTAK
jgi:hypothetical protein